MRSPERIPKILKGIEEIWKNSPDLRLCQLISNLVSENNYNIEDDYLLSEINKYTSKQIYQGQKVHELKIWPSYFEAVKKGTKTFEHRYNDRDFKVGDLLNLREYRPTNGTYSGESAMFKITYLLSLKDDMVILSIVPYISDWFAIFYMNYGEKYISGVTSEIKSLPYESCVIPISKLEFEAYPIWGERINMFQDILRRPAYVISNTYFLKKI